ncbi:MAG: hypothetical protein COV70_03285, partial [Parcubacteria group bacterium CG11_big_fil_rev_8_21_14_0_20_39_22]
EIKSQQPSPLPPSYKEIFEEIGRQLKLRKSALFKRIFLITWPYILLIIVSYVLNLIYDFKSFSQDQTFTYLKILIPYLLVAAFYSSIVRFIFKIEKQIWIDSFFDKKNLEPSESWRIAKKLFWPAFAFRIKLWLRYYFIPIVVIIIAFGLLIQVFVPTFNSSNSYEIILNSSLILFAVFVIGLVAYGYYLKTKLRYTYFIFLDKFGTASSYKSMLEEMNKLNNVSKSETFKKSLILSIGANSLNSIAQLAIESISFGVSQFGNTGKMVGNIMRVYGEEASRQATDLGNIAAQYVLYRFARKEVYGTEQEVNENIYKMFVSKS